MDAQDEIKLAGDPLQEIRDLGAENLENNVSEQETTRKEQIEPTSSNTEGSTSEVETGCNTRDSILFPGKNKVLYLSKPIDGINYECKLYSKCVLNKEFKAIRFNDRTLVPRPANTTFRVGYEVFLCSKGRPDAIGKKFTFLGVFLNNKKYPHSCSALLLDEAMFQVHQALSSSKEDDFSLKVFRIAPIDMVAKVPGGKEFSSENCKLIDEAGAYAAVYFLDFVAKNKMLRELDFVEIKTKIEPTKKSVRILSGNNKKLQQDDHTIETSKISDLHCAAKLPSTPQVTAIDINQLFQAKPTPPFVRKITQRVTASVIAHIDKANATQIATLQTEAKKAARVTQENKSLKAKLAEQAAIIRSLQKNQETDTNIEDTTARPNSRSKAAKLKFVSPEATATRQSSSDEESSSDSSEITSESSDSSNESELEKKKTNKKKHIKKTFSHSSDSESALSESSNESKQNNKKKKHLKKRSSKKKKSKKRKASKRGLKKCKRA